MIIVDTIWNILNAINSPNENFYSSSMVLGIFLYGLLILNKYKKENEKTGYFWLFKKYGYLRPRLDIVDIILSFVSVLMLLFSSSERWIYWSVFLLDKCFWISSIIEFFLLFSNNNRANFMIFFLRWVECFYMLSHSSKKIILLFLCYKWALKCNDWISSQSHKRNYGYTGIIPSLILPITISHILVCCIFYRICVLSDGDINYLLFQITHSLFAYVYSIYSIWPESAPSFILPYIALPKVNEPSMKRTLRMPQKIT